MKKPNEKKFSELPYEIRTLISEGIYSLYKVAKSDNFLLLTDTREAFLIDSDGNILKKLGKKPSMKLEKVIKLAPKKSQILSKINYA